MTLWAATLTGAGFREWLLTLVPPGRNRVPPGQTVDPFGSSMRRFSTQVAEWLPLIREGQPIPGGQRRQDQTFIDLRSIGLVDRDAPVLTAFGNAVLDAWEALDAPKSFEYELPRAVALLREALRLQVEAYVRRLEFWWDIRTLYSVDNLLADHETLLLLPYLNQTLADFNPWAVLLGVQQRIAGPYDWGAIKAAVADRTADTDHALDLLAEKTADTRSVPARVAFCRAMELLFVYDRDPRALTPALESLKLPQ